MKSKRFTGTTFGLLAACGVAWGCSGLASDCVANANCGPYNANGATGGTDTGGGGGTAAGGSSGSSGSSASGTSGTSSAGDAGNAGAPPAMCDPTANPAADSCVIGDSYGLFVSISGDDTAGDGTEAKPFATVTMALSATGPGKINRVYVCGSVQYLEPGTLMIPDRVAIYGGFTCDAGAWAYDASGATRAQLKSASPVGAMIDSATHGVRLQDVRIDAANAPEDGTGASSFGVVVNASTGVVFTRVEIRAGKGGGGKAGTDGVSGADGAAALPAQDGAAATCTGAPPNQDGGKGAALVCGSQGGNGGAAHIGMLPSAAQTGADGYPATSTNGGPGATLVGTLHPGGAGLIGSGGLPGSLGDAASPIGVFSVTGFTPANGGSGLPGEPGQGGGGGGASLGTATCVGASGGAGGMGGCGGDPGTGGMGGGASVALLSWNSAVSINACVLVASTGGAGGRGGNAHAGGVGKAGGMGGTADAVDGIGPGGAGGIGGIGGNGGNGAGGTGGPSVALVYAGTRPDDSASPATLTKGAGGALGVGGKVGGTSALLPGADGQVGTSATEYAVP